MQVQSPALHIGLLSPIWWNPRIQIQEPPLSTSSCDLIPPPIKEENKERKLILNIFREIIGAGYKKY